MTADYNGWADRPEEEREAEEAAEEVFGRASLPAAPPGESSAAEHED